MSFIKNNILLVLFIFLFIFAKLFFVDVFYIPSSSMEPSLFKGDYVLVNKGNNLIKKDLDLKRGDVIVFKEKDDNSFFPKYIIKRVIGVSGDSISYNNKVLNINENEIISDELSRLGSVVVKNEHLIGVDHKIQLDDSINRNNDSVSINIGNNEYFAMGDNRDNSMDSRFFGVVDKKNIVGKYDMTLINFRNIFADIL